MLSIGGVFKVYCGCLVGIDGRCNYVFVIFFVLDEYCKEREKIFIKLCIFKLCKWNILRKWKSFVLLILVMLFYKYDYSK